MRCLEEMRVQSAAEYTYVLDYLKTELGRARRVTLFNASSTRDFIANAAIARDVKCRTLAGLIDDMERTIEKIKQEPEAEEPSLLPPGL